MNIRTFIQKNYDLVRESGSIGFSILVHAILFVMFFFITFAASPVMRNNVIAAITRTEKQEVEKPKPQVRPRDTPQVPVKMQSMPKPKVTQKIDTRIAVKKPIKTDFVIKPITSKTKRALEIKSVVTTGRGIRSTFSSTYGNTFGVSGSGGGIKAKIESFVAIQYSGGDWDCEFPFSFKGSIPNLIYEVERRTDIEVVCKTTVVVRADSPEIMKSPFVYFTGHQNFTLTEPEVENLRTYLLHGYAIVANSSLPGRRSRFDVAFRREMKRVIPDHELEPITKSHPLFSAFASFERVPVGMNYYTEPIEVITIEDRVVVIYNLNDYGDFMLGRLDETGKTILHERWEFTKDAKGKQIREKVDWWSPRVKFMVWNGGFRNLYAGCDNPDIVRNAFVFNINILAYLLAR